MAENRIVYRPATQADIPAINGLYNRVFGENRSLETYRWEFLQNPFGTSPAWVAEDTNTNQIIGHHAVIPLKLRQCRSNVVLLTGKIENTMLAPEWRGRGIYKELECRAQQKYREQGYDVLWSSAYHSRKARERAGFQRLFTAKCVILAGKRALNPVHWPRLTAKKRNRHVATMPLQEQNSFRCGDLSCEVTRDFPEDCEFCSWHTESDFIIADSAAHAHWRFKSNPYLWHWFLTVSLNKANVALLVLTPLEITVGHVRTKILTVSDFHVEKTCTKQQLKQICIAVQQVNPGAFAAIWFNPENERMVDIITVWREAALISWTPKQEIPVMAKSRDQELAQTLRRGLWFTGAFTEGKWA